MRASARLLAVALGAAACTSPADIAAPQAGEPSAEILPWHGLQAFAVRAQAERCERASDASQWRRLRQEVDPVALPADGVDFASADCILVVLDPAMGRRRLHVEVATEEGVDVVVLSAVSPSATSEPAWTDGQGCSVAARLVVPRRSRQLAVVLRLDSAHDGQGERTLAVFSPP